VKSLHPYYIIEDIVKELDIEIKQMAGCSKEHATFMLIGKYVKGAPRKVLHGACGGTRVILGIGMAARKEFELHDPESISKITDFIKSDPPWRPASR
jgi:hypothetical protein